MSYVTKFTADFINILNQTIVTGLITTYGALIGLTIAVFMIMKKIHPAYSLITGAFLGGVIGLVGTQGVNSLQVTTGFMIGGSQNMVPAVMRIITAGVLAGILIESGAASKIADQITKAIPGEKGTILALSLAAMVLTAVGIFIDVAIITIAPIAMSTAKKTKIPVAGLLFAMLGGGKAGNLLSPNPNTIAASDAFNVGLVELMLANLPAALVGLALTFVLSLIIVKKTKIDNFDDNLEIKEESNQDSLSIYAAVSGPVTAIALLLLGPILGVAIDPLIALPVGGLVGLIVMGKIRHANEYITSGLLKMTDISIILLATGAMAGIIANSQIPKDLVEILKWANIPVFLLAPISGTLMSAATASTTAAVAVASAAFANTIKLSVSAMAGAAMLHAGATIFDHLPHGSFFHATAGVTNMQINDRLKLIPYETLVGVVMTIVSTIMWGLMLG